MLPITTSTLRVFIHVLAATVWVGGQLTLAGLVPGLRDLDARAPSAVARRFNAIAWPAYGVLIVTGIWNVIAVHVVWSSTYGTTLIVKLSLVAASGATAFLHGRAHSKRGLAAFGALSGLTALGALFLGTMLR